VLLWAIGDRRRLSEGVLAAIEEAEVAAVSAISLFEISLKRNLGKLRPPVEDVVGELEHRGFALLEITPEHAWAAGALPLHHRDPFDRLLVAQAQLDGLAIVTRDPAISHYQVAVLAA